MEMDERISVPIRRDPPEVEVLLNALRETEQLFFYGFDNAPIGMSLTRLDGTYFRVNKAFCRMLNRSEDELVDAAMLDITHPDDRAASETALRQLREGRISSFQAEKRYLAADGSPVWAL